jgi:hypothetical protein
VLSFQSTLCNSLNDPQQAAFSSIRQSWVGVVKRRARPLEHHRRSILTNVVQSVVPGRSGAERDAPFTIKFAANNSTGFAPPLTNNRCFVDPGIGNGGAVSS